MPVTLKGVVRRRENGAWEFFKGKERFSMTGGDQDLYVDGQEALIQGDMEDATFKVKRWFQTYQQFNEFTPEQDKERTNVHYMLPARFFDVLTGGKWHTYSCNRWENIENPDPTNQEHQTISQEQKLDIYAKLMELNPDKRILEIGSGWGGPLIYLCKKYGVTGHGLMLSENQHAYASAWAKKEGVNCKFEVCHWEKFKTNEPFDATFSDEVTVHICRMGDFYQKIFSLLKEDGVTVNKELRIGHPDFGLNPPPASKVVSELFGETGNYRSLAEELTLANNAGFSVEEIYQMDRYNYVLTGESWRRNLQAHKEEMIQLVGEETYIKFMKYLVIVNTCFKKIDGYNPYPPFEIQFIKCRKLPKKFAEGRGLFI